MIGHPDIRRVDRGGGKSRARARGFTLIEMMVVIFIIAAIMAVAVPKFGDVFQTNIKGAMRAFTGMVKFCFHEAVIKQTIIRLMIDPATGQYWPTVMAESNGVGEFMDMSGSDVISKKASLPPGIRFADVMTPHNIFKVDRDQAYINFLPTGYAEKAVVHLVDTTGVFYTLLVQPLTGGVEILDGYVDLAQIQNTKGPFSESSGLGN